MGKGRKWSRKDLLKARRKVRMNPPKIKPVKYHPNPYKPSKTSLEDSYSGSSAVGGGDVKRRQSYQHRYAGVVGVSINGLRNEGRFEEIVDRRAIYRD